jgi:hypothetical protein
MGRFLEPSTWAGLAALSQVVAAFVPPTWQPFAHGVTALAGTLAVKLREGPK